MAQTLTITLTDEGGIKLAGPINNKFITVAMLELAKEALFNFHRDQAQKVKLAGLDEIPKIVGGD